MKAEEIIPATHRLEQSGMTRNEAEAIVELAKMETRLFWKLSAAMLAVGALIVSILGFF